MVWYTGYMPAGALKTRCVTVNVTWDSDFEEPLCFSQKYKSYFTKKTEVSKFSSYTGLRYIETIIIRVDKLFILQYADDTNKNLKAYKEKLGKGVYLYVC